MEALKILGSFARFVMAEAPALAPQLGALALRWGKLRGIPESKLMEALKLDTQEKAKEVDDEIDAYMKSTFGG